MSALTAIKAAVCFIKEIDTFQSFVDDHSSNENPMDTFFKETKIMRTAINEFEKNPLDSYTNQNQLIHVLFVVISDDECACISIEYEY